MGEGGRMCEKVDRGLPRGKWRKIELASVNRIRLLKVELARRLWGARSRGMTTPCSNSWLGVYNPVFPPAVLSALFRLHLTDSDLR